MENRFVNLIRRKHPDWEVHLLALPGLDTQEELDFLSGSVKNGYQLDEVVLVYCMNDVSDLLPQRDEGIARVQKELREMPWLPRNSYLVNTLYHRLKVRLDPFFKNYFGFVRDAYRGPLWEKQKQRLTQFRDFVQSHGGRLAVVTFPFLQLLGPNYEYQFAHQELGQLWRGLGVPQLDLLTIYKELPPAKITVNRFDPHPNEYAHALAAEAIDEFLREQMKDLKTANDRE
jgi:hypothetical protein